MDDDKDIHTWMRFGTSRSRLRFEAHLFQGWLVSCRERARVANPHRRLESGEGKRGPGRLCFFFFAVFVCVHDRKYGETTYVGVAGWPVAPHQPPGDQRTCGLCSGRHAGLLAIKGRADCSSAARYVLVQTQLGRSLFGAPCFLLRTVASANHRAS